jgi:hypothetical protein
MRQLGLTIALLAAIPAIALPLFACVAICTVPATLIAGIAAIAMPVPADRDGGGRGHDGAQIVRNDAAPGWFVAR